MVHDEIFSPSFGNRPSYLVGRQDIMTSLIEGLSSAPGSKDRAVVLLGQRGSGKTVLLWELAERAAKDGLVVASPTIAPEAMLSRIVEKIQESGARYVEGARSASLSGGSLGALGFSFGLEFTREVEETKSTQYKLVRLAREVTSAGHGTLILVDELQANSPEVRQLVTVYQEMVGEGLDVSLVMAGLPGAVAATPNDRVLTFLNRARKIKLPSLSISDIDAFYADAFARLGISIDASLRREAAQFTQGSPYMLQLVGHAITQRADGAGPLSEGALRDALACAREDFENDVCSTTLSALSDVDVEFLGAMTADDGPSRVSGVAERMGVTVDYAQKYRRRLIDAGVIEPARRGYVRFAVPYLADHLRRARLG